MLFSLFQSNLVFAFTIFTVAAQHQIDMTNMKFYLVTLNAKKKLSFGNSSLAK